MTLAARLDARTTAAAAVMVLELHCVGSSSVHPPAANVTVGTPAAAATATASAGPPAADTRRALKACDEAARSSTTVLNAALELARTHRPAIVAPTWEPVCLLSDSRARMLRMTGLAFVPTAASDMTPAPVLEYGLIGARGVEQWAAHESLFPDSEPHLGELSEFDSVDLDGDHQPELTFGLSPEHPEGITVRNRYFLTQKRGRIVPYDFPGETWEDVDHDGRMDAVSSMHQWVHTAWWDEIGLRRVRRLLHQRADGTFVSDELSREFLRRDCPEAPERVIVRDAKGLIDEGETALRIECARLRGESADALMKRIAEYCRSEPEPGAPSERSPGACRFRDELERIVFETNAEL